MIPPRTSIYSQPRCNFYSQSHLPRLADLVEKKSSGNTDDTKIPFNRASSSQAYHPYPLEFHRNIRRMWDPRLNTRRVQRVADCTPRYRDYVQCKKELELLLSTGGHQSKTGIFTDLKTPTISMDAYVDQFITGDNTYPIFDEWIVDDHYFYLAIDEALKNKKFTKEQLSSFKLKPLFGKLCEVPRMEGLISKPSFFGDLSIDFPGKQACLFNLVDDKGTEVIDQPLFLIKDPVEEIDVESDPAEDLHFFLANILGIDNNQHWAQEHIEDLFWPQKKIDREGKEVIENAFPKGQEVQRINGLDLKKLLKVARENQQTNVKASIYDPRLKWADEKILQKRVLEVANGITKKYLKLVNDYEIAKEVGRYNDIENNRLNTKAVEGEKATQVTLGQGLDVLKRIFEASKEAYYYGEHVPILKFVGAAILDIFNNRNNFFPVRSHMGDYAKKVRPLIENNNFTPEFLEMVLELYASENNMFFNFAVQGAAFDRFEGMEKYTAALKCAIDRSPNKLRLDAFMEHEILGMDQMPSDPLLMEGKMYIRITGDQAIEFAVQNPNDPNSLIIETILPLKFLKSCIDNNIVTFSSNYLKTISTDLKNDILETAGKAHCVVYKSSQHSAFEIFMLLFKKQFYLPTFLTTKANPNDVTWKKYSDEEAGITKRLFAELSSDVKHGNIDKYLSGEKQLPTGLQNVMYEIHVDGEGHSVLPSGDILFSLYNFYQAAGLKLMEFDKPDGSGKELRVVIILEMIDRSQADPTFNPQYDIRVSKRDPGGDMFKAEGGKGLPIMHLFPKIEKQKDGKEVMTIGCRLPGKEVITIQPFKEMGDVEGDHLSSFIFNGLPQDAYQSIINVLALYHTSQPRQNLKHFIDAAVQEHAEAINRYFAANNLNGRTIPDKWQLTRISNTQRSRGVGPATLVVGILNVQASFRRNGIRTPEYFPKMDPFFQNNLYLLTKAHEAIQSGKVPDQKSFLAKLRKEIRDQAGDRVKFDTNDYSKEKRHLLNTLTKEQALKAIDRYETMAYLKSTKGLIRRSLERPAKTLTRSRYHGAAASKAGASRKRTLDLAGKERDDKPLKKAMKSTEHVAQQQLNGKENSELEIRKKLAYQSSLLESTEQMVALIEQMELMDSKKFILPGKYIAPDVSTKLYCKPEMNISHNTVDKVNKADLYLRNLSFELKGVESDGNCFFSAFLGSYETLSTKRPMLERMPTRQSKLTYLRKLVHKILLVQAKDFKDIEKVEMLKRDGEWVKVEEGAKLAGAFDLPIRVITPFGKGEINEDLTTDSVMDYLYSSKEDGTDWNLVKDKPDQFVTIVDLGGHFVFAQSIVKA